MHFANAIYLPSFSISGIFAKIDSNRHKESEQQAINPAGN